MNSDAPGSVVARHARTQTHTHTLSLFHFFTFSAFSLFPHRLFHFFFSFFFFHFFTFSTHTKSFTPGCVRTTFCKDTYLLIINSRAQFYFFDKILVGSRKSSLKSKLRCDAECREQRTAKQKSKTNHEKKKKKKPENTKRKHQTATENEVTGCPFLSVSSSSCLSRSSNRMSSCSRVATSGGERTSVVPVSRLLHRSRLSHEQTDPAGAKKGGGQTTQEDANEAANCSGGGDCTRIMSFEDLASGLDKQPYSPAIAGSNLPVGNRLRQVCGESESLQARAVEYAATARPLVHERVFQLMVDFYRLQRASARSQQLQEGEYVRRGECHESQLGALYAQLDLPGCLNRFVAKRPLSFFNETDNHLLRDGTHSIGCFDRIEVAGGDRKGADQQSSPYVMANALHCVPAGDEGVSKLTLDEWFHSRYVMVVWHA